MSGTSSATNFGTAAVYHFANNLNDNNLLMNNNPFINLSTAKGSGRAIAFQRSSNNLGNYILTSNTNAFYAGTPGRLNLIYADNVNQLQTLTAYQTFVAPRDALSVTENPAFISTTCGSPNFLHLTVGSPSALANAGQPIAAVINDYDDDPRDALSPDIGADEFSPGTVAALQETPVIRRRNESSVRITGIAPNPVQSNAVLSTNVQKSGQLQLIVCDLTGRSLIRQTAAVTTGMNAVTIDMSKLVSGNYTVTAAEASGERKSINFVKL